MSTRFSRCTDVLTDTAGAGRHRPSSRRRRKSLQSRLPQSSPIGPPSHLPRSRGYLAGSSPVRAGSVPVRSGTGAFADAAVRPPSAWPRDRRGRGGGRAAAGRLRSVSRSFPTPCGSTSLARQMSCVGSWRRRPSSTSSSSSALRCSSASTSRLPSGAPRPTSAGRSARHRGCLARHRDTVRVRGDGRLADVPAVATPADLRRRRSDPRQGRRLLRLLAPVPAPGVRDPARGSSRSRPASWRWCTRARGALGIGAAFARRSGPRCTWRPRRRLPARRRVEVPPRAVRARARPAVTTRRPLLLRRRIRGRQRPAARARGADRPRRRAGRRLSRRAASSPERGPSELRSGSWPSRRRCSSSAVALVGALIPALVQRYRRRPEPAAQRAALPGASIAATRTGLGLDAIDVEPYSPTGTFTRRRLPAAERAARQRPDLGHVAARGQDAPARHRHAVLQPRGADARRRASRRTAAADGRERPRARPRPGRAREPSPGSTTGSPTPTGSG